MKTKRCYFFFPLFLLFVFTIVHLHACSSNDDSSLNGIEMINYYGTQIPYMPLEEKDFPEWLRQLKKEKRMMALYRICVGTIDNRNIYHLNLWTDSSNCGLFFDNEGHPINFDSDFRDFITQITNVRCIYYQEFSDKSKE